MSLAQLSPSLLSLFHAKVKSTPMFLSNIWSWMIFVIHTYTHGLTKILKSNNTGQRIYYAHKIRLCSDYNIRHITFTTTSMSKHEKGFRILVFMVKFEFTHKHGKRRGHADIVHGNV